MPIEMMPASPNNPEVVKLIKAIDEAVKHADPDAIVNALSFYLLGAVQITFELGPGIETAEFCAKYFKIYAEQLKWGGSRSNHSIG